jgi:hypothetical protein
VALYLDERPARLYRGLDHGSERDPLLAQVDLAARDARDLEQVIDQANHVADLALHHF